jgi:hypothetical protein
MEGSRIDIVLRRDWFVCDDDIFEILENADQETFDFLLKNISRYPQRVRDCIDPSNWGMGPYRKWWGDYSDAQMETDKKEWGAICLTNANRMWNLYKEEHGLEFQRPPPPSEKVDLAKKDLEDYMAKKYPKGISYMNRQTDTNIREMDKRIQASENEYKLIKDIQRVEDELRETSAKLDWANHAEVR